VGHPCTKFNLFRFVDLCCMHCDVRSDRKVERETENAGQDIKWHYIVRLIHEVGRYTKISIGYDILISARLYDVWKGWCPILQFNCIQMVAQQSCLLLIKWLLATLHDTSQLFRFGGKMFQQTGVCTCLLCVQTWKLFKVCERKNCRNGTGLGVLWYIMR